MYQIQIDKVFSASHAIRLADGTFEPLHGHNWPVSVTVKAEQLDTMDTVMDFHLLEGWLKTLLDSVHNRHLNDVPPFADGQGKLLINPTAERVACWIGTEMAKRLPHRVTLLRVQVGEAPGCSAIYLP